MSKIFVVFLAAPWRLGTEETDWMDDGGGVVVGELWCSTRGLMRVCELSVLLGLWPTAPAAAAPHPPAAAREHFITYTTSFEAARWGRVYNIVREAHRGRKQQPGGRYVWRVTSHTFYNYKRTKTSKHAMFSSFLAWNHWGKNSMKKIAKFWIIFLFLRIFPGITPLENEFPQKRL